MPLRKIAPYTCKEYYSFLMRILVRCQEKVFAILKAISKLNSHLKEIIEIVLCTLFPKLWQFPTQIFSIKTHFPGYQIWLPWCDRCFNLSSSVKQCLCNISKICITTFYKHYRYKNMSIGACFVTIYRWPLSALKPAERFDLINRFYKVRSWSGFVKCSMETIRILKT